MSACAHAASRTWKISSRRGEKYHTKCHSTLKCIQSNSDLDYFDYRVLSSRNSVNFVKIFLSYEDFGNFFFFRRQDHQFKNFFLILSLYFSFQRRIYINFVQYIFRIISFLPNFIISLHSA